MPTDLGWAAHPLDGMWCFLMHLAPDHILLHDRICFCRYSKHGIGSTSSSSLQAPGSLASSMTNVSSLQVTSKYGRGMGGTGLPGAGAAVAANSSRKHVGNYVSPYAQRR
jgi:hypothetical protein